MPRSFLRLAILGALMGTAAMGGAQAQESTAPPPVAALPNFTGIVQRNAPAVVHVEAKYDGMRQPYGSNGPGGANPFDDPQMQIFRHFFGMPMMPSPEDQAHTSLGSGFIISPDGYILTNAHVVRGADSVTVRLQDRRTLTAKVVGADPTYDIALLKVNAGAPLPTVTIGNSSTLEPGQWVLAIGSQFGFDYTVTQGIVSAVGRNLGTQDQPYTSFIQTDVPINPGNSGGPLFNLQGRVVGVNSQIYSGTGGYQGVSFSIPIDVAMNVVQQLRTKGYVSHGVLGVAVQPINDNMVKALKLATAEGAIVGSVTAGSGAEQAGIRPGDIILAYDGKKVRQASDLPPMVGLTKPGTTVPVQVLRNGQQLILQVKIGASPRDGAAGSGDGGNAPMHGMAALGFTVKDLDAAARQQLGLSRAQGGVVIDNVTGGVAAAVGLQPGDAILMFNQQRVTGAAQFRELARNIQPGQTVLLLVKHGSITAFVSVTVPDGKSALPATPDDGMDDSGN